MEVRDQSLSWVRPSINGANQHLPLPPTHLRGQAQRHGAQRARGLVVRRCPFPPAAAVTTTTVAPTGGSAAAAADVGIRDAEGLRAQLPDEKHLVGGGAVWLGLLLKGR